MSKGRIPNVPQVTRAAMSRQLFVSGFSKGDRAAGRALRRWIWHSAPQTNGDVGSDKGMINCEVASSSVHTVRRSCTPSVLRQRLISPPVLSMRPGLSPASSFALAPAARWTDHRPAKRFSL
jgi:hypothetical protein